MTDHGRRPAAYLIVGKMFAQNFHEALGIPLSEAPYAIATCYLEVMGWQKGNHDGKAPRTDREKPWMGQTRLATSAINSDHFQIGPRQKTSKWRYSHNVAGMNDILNVFGLEINDVLNFYGNVGPTDRKVWDLVEILVALCPEFFSDEERAKLALAIKTRK